MMRRKQERAEKGMYNVRVKISFGYRYDPSLGYFVITKEEAEIVKEAFELYSTGVGSSQIERILTEKYPFQTKSLHDNTIRRWLKKPILARFNIAAPITKVSTKHS